MLPPSRCPICANSLITGRDGVSKCAFCRTTFGQANLPFTVEELTPQGTPQATHQGGLKYDSGKLRFSLIPPIATTSLAEVLTFGAAKYAPNSWQTVPNGEERYLDALYRHLEAYRNGELTDPESGLSHLAHAITNVAFLLHFESQRKDTNV